MMNTKKWQGTLVLAVILGTAQCTLASVPLRLSIKFIVSAAGTRPITGNHNTDAEINTDIAWANAILRANNSEFRVSVLELDDLSGVSSWYNSGSTSANRDSLRSAAIAAPTTYRWRSDAINVYVNAGGSSAISSFPPDNNIILMNQWCGNTPSCILHELGHSLNLMHTHEPCCTNQDECADTISDNSSWTRDQISSNNYGAAYAALTPAQQDQVDLVFNNVMSYHTSEPQLRISGCQMDRVSTQGDGDRGWLLSRDPVYVDNTYTGGIENGRFPTPFKTVQGAVSSGLENETLVLEQGVYDEPVSSLNGDNTLVVPRSGTAKVGNGALKYSLPTDLENSETAEVRRGARDAASEDNAARKALKDMKKVQKAPFGADTGAGRAEAAAISRLHRQNAIDHLKGAEPHARGRERVAIVLEIAQRYRDLGDCESAAEYFKRVSEETEQIHLKERAILEITMCSQKEFLAP